MKSAAVALRAVVVALLLLQVQVQGQQAMSRWAWGGGVHLLGYLMGVDLGGGVVCSARKNPGGAGRVVRAAPSAASGVGDRACWAPVLAAALLDDAICPCSPLPGQGVPDISTKVVYVSVYLDRLIQGEPLWAETATGS